MRFAVLLLLFLLLIPVSAQSTPPNNRTAALDVLARVNEWHLEEGLAPLKENDALTQMALAQAEYVYPRLEEVAADYTFHDDADGRDAQARAVELFDWATIRRSKLKLAKMLPVVRWSMGYASGRDRISIVAPR